MDTISLTTLSTYNSRQSDGVSKPEGKAVIHLINVPSHVLSDYLVSFLGYPAIENLRCVNRRFKHIVESYKLQKGHLQHVWDHIFQSGLLCHELLAPEPYEEISDMKLKAYNLNLLTESKLNHIELADSPNSTQISSPIGTEPRPPSQQAVLQFLVNDLFPKLYERNKSKSNGLFETIQALSAAPSLALAFKLYAAAENYSEQLKVKRRLASFIGLCYKSPSFWTGLIISCLFMGPPGLVSAALLLKQIPVMAAELQQIGINLLDTTTLPTNSQSGEIAPAVLPFLLTFSLLSSSFMISSGFGQYLSNSHLARVCFWSETKFEKTIDELRDRLSDQLNETSHPLAHAQNEPSVHKR